MDIPNIYLQIDSAMFSKLKLFKFLLNSFPELTKFLPKE